MGLWISQIIYDHVVTTTTNSLGFRFHVLPLLPLPPLEEEEEVYETVDRSYPVGGEPSLKRHVTHTRSL